MATFAHPGRFESSVAAADASTVSSTSNPLPGSRGLFEHMPQDSPKLSMPGTDPWIEIKGYFLT